MMRAMLLGLALASVPALAVADEPATTQQPQASAAERLKKNPNDVQALNDYMVEMVNKVMTAARSAPDEADKALAELKDNLQKLEPTEDDAKALLERARSVIGFLAERIDLARQKLEDLEAKLKASPNDAKALNQYASKLMDHLGEMASEAPDQAKAHLEKAKGVIAGIKANAAAEIRPQIQRVEQALAQLDQQIATEISRSQLIGKDAPPISAEAWVNGEALAPEDLKGKVVLLDFWAVWCGPCIATFPHLIEWNEKYADKGLVIVGLTRYYNFKWDDAANEATRADDEVPHDVEQQMLKKFADQHGLKHVFAVQSDDTLTDFYGVTGIPQAVVIDRAGKVRMVKVGSGDANAQAISGLLEELISQPAAAGE